MGKRSSPSKGKDAQEPVEEPMSERRTMLVGFFLLSLILCPILGAGLFLMKLGTYVDLPNSGDPVLIGVGLGLAAAAALSFILTKRTRSTPEVEL